MANLREQQWYFRDFIVPAALERPMRITRDEMLMRMAMAARDRGTCLRRKVGALLARESRPLMSGYVGVPTGDLHCTPETCGPGKPCTRTIHAEANAIARAAREGIATDGTWLYTTASPCMECAKLILPAGIRVVVYYDEYRDMTPVEYLRNHGISVISFQTMAPRDGLDE